MGVLPPPPTHTRTHTHTISINKLGLTLDPIAPLKNTQQVEATIHAYVYLRFLDDIIFCRFFDANSSDSGDSNASDEPLETSSPFPLKNFKSHSTRKALSLGRVLQPSPLSRTGMASLSQITLHAAKKKAVAAQAEATLRQADAAVPALVATTVAIRNRPIECICIWPAGGLFATGGRDGSVCTWELEPKMLRSSYPPTTLESLRTNGGTREMAQSQHPVAELKGHTGWVRAVAFSPDGMVLASGSGDATVRLWSSEDWSCITVLSGHTGWVRAVVFAAALPNKQADGMRIVSGANDSMLRIWKKNNVDKEESTSSWKLCTVLKGHKKEITSCVTRGTHIFSASADGTVRVWALEDGHCLRVLAPLHPRNGNSCVPMRHLHSCDSSEFEVFAVGSDGILSAWKIGSWDAVPGFQLGIGRFALRSLAANPNGKGIMIAGDDAILRTYSVSAGGSGLEGRNRLEGYFKLESLGSEHAAPILDIVVVPLGVGRGSIAVTVSKDGSIKKWKPVKKSPELV